jgi:adenosylmethionine-8-amino-7-oxononanoate aminotransferase
VTLPHDSRSHTRIEPAGSHVFYRDLTRSYPVIDRAAGCYLWDVDGNRYLDATGGAVVVSLGHGIEAVLAAMRAQAERVCYAYPFQFTSDAQEDLAAELADFAGDGLQRVFFVSGGSEGTETAIKLARQYHIENGEPSRQRVISRWRGYHGNTVGALSASGHPLRRQPYLPYLADFSHIDPPYRYRCQRCAHADACTLSCADALEEEILRHGAEQISAFICEPVGGSSAAGMVPAPGYFARVREICDRHGVLFIADEVLCGMGRTGRNMAIDHWETVPDMIVCAKGLSSGYTPLGAVIASERIYEAIAAGSGRFEHGYTYGGNPLSCAVGLAVLRVLRSEGLVERAAEIGKVLLARLAEALEDVPAVGSVEGLGLLAGVELVADRATKRPYPRSDNVSGRVVQEAFDRGVVILPGSGGQADGINGDRLEIAPPLTVSVDQIDALVDVVGAAIRAAVPPPDQVGSSVAGGRT